MSRRSSRNAGKQVSYVERHECCSHELNGTKEDCDNDDASLFVIGRKNVYLCPACHTQFAPDARAKEEEEAAIVDDTEEEEDDYAPFVAVHGTNLAAERIAAFQEDIKRLSLRILEHAPAFARDNLLRLISNGISNQKIRAYHPLPRFCEAVVQIVLPDVSVLYAGGTTSVPPNRSPGRYYVIFPGHAVVVIKTGATTMVYDPNGADRLSADRMDILRAGFGDVTVCSQFRPHRTEDGTILSNNIFLGVPGRCACWSLFVLLCVDGVQDVTDKTMEALHGFFEREVTGNQARVLSSYLLSFFVRVLYLYDNRARVAHTAMEKKLMPDQITRTTIQATFAYLRSLAPRVRLVLDQLFPEKYHEFFRQKRMGGTGAARGGWTWRKLVQHVNAGKPVVVNQFSHRRTSGGQHIPPPSHIKVIVCIRHGTTWVPCDESSDHAEQDYDGDLVIRASVPYDVLQLELGENERLAWRHVLEWIQRTGHRKFGHVCYPETAGGGPVIDFQRLFAPCNDEGRNLDCHFQVGDGQSCFFYVPAQGEAFYPAVDMVLHAGVRDSSLSSTSVRDGSGVHHRPILSEDLVFFQEDYRRYRDRGFSNSYGSEFNSMRPQFSYLLSYRRLDEFAPTIRENEEQRLYDRFVRRQLFFFRLTTAHFPRYMIYNYHPEVPTDEGRDWWIREDGLVGLRKVTLVRESNTLRPFQYFFMSIQTFRRMQSAANDGGCLLYRILVHREQQRIRFYDAKRLAALSHVPNTSGKKRKQPE